MFRDDVMKKLVFIYTGIITAFIAARVVIDYFYN